MTLKNDNYYGFDHKLVNDKFLGNLRYIGTLPIGNTSHPWALYLSENPNRDLGHKEIMMLMSIDGKGMVSGRDISELGGKLTHTWLHCKLCGDYIVSQYTHDFKFCSCRECSIDGGMEYIKVTGDPSDYELIEWDYLNGTRVTEV